VLSALKIRKR